MVMQWMYAIMAQYGMLVYGIYSIYVYKVCMVL